MNFKIDKDIISKRFEKSISSYNSNALAQKNIAKELMQKIINNRTTLHRHVLEIGCGTGFLTNELLRNFRPEKYIINDLSALMRNEIKKVALAHKFENWQFLAGDAEKLDIPSQFDLVLSASVFQWFRDMAGFAASISQSIRKDGILAFSTFGTENFREIKNLKGTGLCYPVIEELTSWLLPSFQVIDCSEKLVRLHFESPYDVLKHIKRTGVNAIENRHWNKRDLIDFETKYYQNYSTPDGMVSLTYHPIIIIARKK